MSAKRQKVVLDRGAFLHWSRADGMVLELEKHKKFIDVFAGLKDEEAGVWFRISRERLRKFLDR